MTLNIDKLFQEALDAHVRGDLSNAKEAYEQILREFGEHAEAFHHLGLIHMQTGNLTLAEQRIKRSLLIQPKQPSALSNLGLCLSLMKRYEESISECKKSIDIDPTGHGAWTNLGNAQNEIGLTAEAKESFGRALLLDPNNPQYHYNLANIYFKQSCLDQAIDTYRHCLSIDNTIAQAHHNLAVCYLRKGNLEPASEHAETAVALVPSYDEAWRTRGDISRELGMTKEAIQFYDKALTLNRDSGETWLNRARALSEIRKYDLAMQSYEFSLEKSPELDYILGDLVLVQMQACHWKHLSTRKKQIESGISHGRRIAQPFLTLALLDSPRLQLKAASEARIAKVPISAAHLPMHNPTERKGKIAVGYFSMDFQEHPVARLIVDLIETHSREKFTVIGFSLGRDDGGPMRKRLQRAFDEFIDVSTWPVDRVVQLARERKLDIAIDLMGYTRNARPEIFSRRCAPIQISYLGYPGTTGADYMDYLIADSTVITAQNRPFFSERILYLPDCYQANDSKRPTQGKTFTREEFGLPGDGFVYCSFNNTWKIQPDMFALWMQILKRVDNSVLWIYVDHPFSFSNLCREAQERGVESARLVMARPEPHQRHLARYSVADLFLDTYPYNAHTTASDALWAGTPVVTLAGETFASRVAASLLATLDLRELVAETPSEYVDIATSLAKDPSRLSSLRDRLSNNRDKSYLVDTRRFTDRLEWAYLQVFRRRSEGMEDQDIEVSI